MNELTNTEIRLLFEMIAESYRSIKIDEYGTSTPIGKNMHYESLLDNIVYAIEYPDVVRERIHLAEKQREIINKQIDLMKNSGFSNGL